MSVYKRPTRRITTPTVLVMRKVCEHRDAQHRPIPMNRVPVEERSGMVRLMLVSGVEINGPETGSVYPNGAHFECQRSCSISLEVLPRDVGRDTRARHLQEPPFIGRSDRVQRIPLQRTPLVVSREPYTHWGATSMGSSHLTLVEPGRLLQYLMGALPYLGVDPVDAPTVVRYVQGLLKRGEEELIRMDREMARRRQ